MRLDSKRHLGSNASPDLRDYRDISFKMESTNGRWIHLTHIQYIPRNMHMVFVLLCFVMVIHRLIFPYPSGLLHWHCGNLMIAQVLAKQPWWIWINTSCEFIMNDCITATKQSTTKPCAYFLGYTVTSTAESCSLPWRHHDINVVRDLFSSGPISGIFVV